MDFPGVCYLKILNGVSGGGYLLSGSADFTPTALHLASTDDGSPRMRWRLIPVEGGPDDTFNITFVPDDQGITYLTWTEDSVMFGDGDSGTGEQRWQLIPTEDASYLIKAAPVPDQSATDRPFLSCSADGARVDMFSEDDLSGRQRWFVTADSGRVPPSRPRLTDADIPPQAKPGFFITIPTADFQSRLTQGGTLRLSGKDLDLGGADPGNDDRVFMALDALELNQARIITGGKELVIFVNRLTSQFGSIISYTDSQRKAARGADGVGTGQSGRAGVSGTGGGSVSIYVIEQLDGLLKVDLRGRDGGDGGNGTIGFNGGPGSQGQDANPFNGPLGQAGNGGDGNPGQTGGSGGNGGNGGDGGVLKLVNAGASPISDTSVSFSATGGQGGISGQPAAGGAGGPGGSGGAGNNSGTPPYPPGSHGAQGPHGANGTAGVRGTLGGNGQANVNNMDLEAVVRLASRYLERSP